MYHFGRSSLGLELGPNSYSARTNDSMANIGRKASRDSAILFNASSLFGNVKRYP